MKTIYYHNGEEDFPHGAGASDPGYYVYVNSNDKDAEPDGPFDTLIEAVEDGGANVHSIAMMVDAETLPDEARGAALFLLAQQSYDLRNALTELMACDTATSREWIFGCPEGSAYGRAVRAIGAKTVEELIEEIGE